MENIRAQQNGGVAGTEPREVAWWMHVGARLFDDVVALVLQAIALFIAAVSVALYEGDSTQRDGTPFLVVVLALVFVLTAAIEIVPNALGVSTFGGALVTTRVRRIDGTRPGAASAIARWLLVGAPVSLLWLLLVRRPWSDLVAVLAVAWRTFVFVDVVRATQLGGVPRHVRLTGTHRVSTVAA